jgi:catechol 2,3-dioxygenase-like lactoylglutathione lyase family enzyme
MDLLSTHRGILPNRGRPAAIREAVRPSGHRWREWESVDGNGEGRRGKMHRVEKLDHVGFAVKDKGRGHRFFTEVLGAVEVMDMEWGGFRFASYLMGSGSMLELIYSADPKNFVNRFIERRGEGIHHLTFKVADIEATVKHLRSLGLNPFDINTSNPMWKECYLHPREALGTLIQFAEFPEEEWVRLYQQKQG